jgi:HNH endonuclease/AP2 domain
VREIALNDGHIALVDDEDFELVAKRKWRYQGTAERGFYVVCTRWGAGHGPNVLMHRVILGLLDRRYPLVDHENGNTLDNRRSNLRIATHGQNQANRRRNKNNRSGFRGVCWNKQARKWQAGVRHLGRSQYLGLFESAEEAARAYDARVIELRGDFARPNFPVEVQA